MTSSFLERQELARAWLVSSEAAAVPRVKLCGMSREADVDAVADVRPDLCGFIVDFPKSHRSVSPSRLAELCARLGEQDHIPEGGHPVWRVGVFVDMPLDKVERIVRHSGIDVVQLHGSENGTYVDELRARMGIGIIQAFRLRNSADAARAEASHADLVLLDNGQGTGHAFDWLLACGIRRPFLLAGGLDSNNVGEALMQVHPWGVDLSSGIETDRVKDPDKMRAVVDAVRAVRWRQGVPSD